MPRIVIRVRDQEDNLITTHFYRKPSCNLADVKSLNDITITDPEKHHAHFYATGIGAKKYAFPPLRAALDRIEAATPGVKYELEVDYTRVSMEPNVTAGHPRGLGYSERYEE